MKFLIFSLLVVSLGLSPVFGQTDLTLTSNLDSYIPGELVQISGVTQNEQIVSIQVKDPTGKTLLVRSITSDSSGNYSLEFKIPKTSRELFTDSEPIISEISELLFCPLTLVLTSKIFCEEMLASSLSGLISILISKAFL